MILFITAIVLLIYLAMVALKDERGIQKTDSDRRYFHMLMRICDSRRSKSVKKGDFEIKENKVPHLSLGISYAILYQGLVICVCDYQVLDTKISGDVLTEEEAKKLIVYLTKENENLRAEEEKEKSKRDKELREEILKQIK